MNPRSLLEWAWADPAARAAEALARAEDMAAGTSGREHQDAVDAIKMLRRLGGAVAAPAGAALKFGKEGYVHGWICERPPCGNPGDAIRHDRHGRGRITGRDDDGTLRARFDDGTESRLGKPGVIHWGILPGSVSARPEHHLLGSASPSMTDWQHAQWVGSAVRHATRASQFGRRDVGRELGRAARALRTGTPEGYLEGARLLEHAAGMAEMPAPPGMAGDVRARAPRYRRMAAEIREAVPGVAAKGIPSYNPPYWEDHAQAVPGIVKVGSEGYIHGWICVRPPCGEKHSADVSPDPGQENVWTVTHKGTGEAVGRIEKHRNGWYYPFAPGPAALGRPSRDVSGAYDQLMKYHDAMRLGEHVAMAAGHPRPAPDSPLPRAAMLFLAGEDEAAVPLLRDAQASLRDHVKNGEIAEGDAEIYRRHLGDLYERVAGTEMPPPADTEMPADPAAAGVTAAEFDDPGRASLRRSASGGVLGADEPGGQGAQAQTLLVTLADGTKAIRKAFGPANEDMADRELLASRVGEAVGVPGVPKVVKTGPGRVFMELVKGKTANRVRYDEYDFDAIDKAKARPEARLIGLMDELTANDDRHAGNWMIRDDGQVIPIDNSSTFGAAGGGSREFQVYPAQFDSEADVKMLDKVRGNLAALEPEFQALSHSTWFAEMMARMDDFAKRAGPVR